MAKNPLKNMVPGKHNPIERNYSGNLDDEVISTHVGITGTNIFNELIRLVRDKTDRNILPDGSIFSAVLIKAVEIKLGNSKYRDAHACMVPRDLWNAYAAAPGGFSMYKCRIALDFKDCIKPAPNHISNDETEMTTRDILRRETYSTAYGLFLKEPQPGEQYDVRALNKTKDFCGDEYIIVDKKAAYDFIRQKTMKETLASAGNFRQPKSAGKLPNGDKVKILRRYAPGSQDLSNLLAAATSAAGVPVSWASDSRLQDIIGGESMGYIGIPNFRFNDSPLFKDPAKGDIASINRIDDWPKVWAAVKNADVPHRELGVASTAVGLGQLQPSNMKRFMPSGKNGLGDPHEEAVGFLKYVKVIYGTIDNAYKFKFTEGGPGVVVRFDTPTSFGMSRPKNHPGKWY